MTRRAKQWILSGLLILAADGLFENGRKREGKMPAAGVFMVADLTVAGIKKGKEKEDKEGRGTMDFGSFAIKHRYHHYTASLEK